MLLIHHRASQLVLQVNLAFVNRQQLWANTSWLDEKYLGVNKLIENLWYSKDTGERNNLSCWLIENFRNSAMFFFKDWLNCRLQCKNNQEVHFVGKNAFQSFKIHCKEKVIPPTKNKKTWVRISINFMKNFPFSKFRKMFAFRRWPTFHSHEAILRVFVAVDLFTEKVYAQAIFFSWESACRVFFLPFWVTP